MSTLEPQTKQLLIIRYPNPILNERSVYCTEEDLPLITESLSEMIRLNDGVKGAGLAAVQVGILKRFCIVRDASGTNNLLINPEITSGDTLVNLREGCLSLPLFFENVERFQSVSIKFRDINWVEREASMTGVEAQCIQHEINHMGGLLILDTVSLLKQQMWKKKAKKKGYL